LTSKYNNLKEKQTIGNTIETEHNARIAEYSIFGPIFDLIIANFWLRGYPVLYICGEFVEHWLLPRKLYLPTLPV